MDKLKKELREIMAWIKTYKSLEGEERSAKRDECKTKLERAKEIDDEIAELEEIEKLEARNNQTVNGGGIDTAGNQNSNVEVQDQPIYRGLHCLGQQMRDVYLAGHPSADYNIKQEARSRLQQVEKRAVEQHNVNNVDDRSPEKRAAGTGGHVEIVGSDGGFLLQGETAQEMFTKGFNNNEILRRCRQMTVGGQFVDIVGIKEESRANGSRGGGVRVYTTAELAAMTQSKTTFEKLRIEPKKLTGLYFASDEILEDVPALSSEMSTLFNDEFAFKAQDLVIEGSGSGEPLGIKNSPAVVTVAKETSQVAKTVVAQNIINMKSRAWLGGMRNMIWIINQDVEPELYNLTIDVGTGGSLWPLYQPGNQANGVFGSMLGFPVIPIEQAETLGTVGDISLVDFGQYVTANKGSINSAMSIHLKFDYNQTTFRFTWRFDGQPRWKTSLTPFKGTNKVSPYVNLATRSA